MSTNKLIKNCWIIRTKNGLDSEENATLIDVLSGQIGVLEYEKQCLRAEILTIISLFDVSAEDYSLISFSDYGRF